MGISERLGQRPTRPGAGILITGVFLALVGCGTDGGPFGANSGGDSAADQAVRDSLATNSPQDSLDRSTLADLFVNVDDAETTLEVNKYLWNASLDILNFLPLRSADPFTGIIVTGFGTPPGGNRPYRATIYVRDPALEARSLQVALATRAGPAPNATVRAVEDAILTRARELRIRDLNL